MAERKMINVIENLSLDEKHFILKLEYPEHIKVYPGNFFMIRSWDREPVLNRPISVFDRHDNKLEFFIKKKGRGTEALSKVAPGDLIFALGPLGTKFENCEDYLAVGAGMGIAPVNYAASYYGLETIYATNTKVTVFDFDESEFNVCTLDGTMGEKGNAMDAVRRKFDSSLHKGIIACGPEAFLEVLAEFCRERNIPLQVSFEEKMGCGTGLCMSCARKYQGRTVKVCKDGPVFKY